MVYLSWRNMELREGFLMPGGMRSKCLISSSSWSLGVEFQIILVFAALSYFIGSWFSLVINFFDNLYHNRCKGWVIKYTGRLRYKCNGRRDSVMAVGFLTLVHDQTWHSFPPFCPGVIPHRIVLVYGL